jgi:hypothetical protein
MRRLFRRVKEDSMLQLLAGFAVVSKPFRLIPVRTPEEPRM